MAPFHEHIISVLMEKKALGCMCPFKSRKDVYDVMGLQSLTFTLSDLRNCKDNITS